MKKFENFEEFALPFQHFKVNQIFEDSILEKFNETMVDFEAKETDIYKIKQTKDLSQNKKLEFLSEMIYGAEFMEKMENLTGCLLRGPPDLSLNKYSKTSHLLIHDDQISTRKISFIIYLSTDYCGGGLELYPIESLGIPASKPTVTIQPILNTMILFRVQPGVSFHAVQEVVSDTPRISISGWFHAREEDQVTLVRQPLIEEPKSTLEQLLLGDSQQFSKVDTAALSSFLTEEDLKYLSTYINPQYLAENTISQVNKMFTRDSYILLSNLLNKDTASKLKCCIEYQDEIDNPGYGRITEHGMMGKNWKCHGPIHLRRYLVLDPVDGVEDNLDNLLSNINKLMSSTAFSKFILQLTSTPFTKIHSAVRRFRPGLDYSLALSNPKPLLHLNLNLTPSSGWEDGEVGGYMTYMESPSPDDPAIYTSTNDDVLLNVETDWNCLSLVMRDEGVLMFVKYTSAFARGSRWDVDLEFEVAPDDDAMEE